MAELERFDRNPDREPDYTGDILVLSEEFGLVYAPMKDKFRQELEDQVLARLRHVVRTWKFVELDFGTYRARERTYQWPGEDRNEYLVFNASDASQWALWRMGRNLYKEITGFDRQNEALKIMEENGLSRSWFGKEENEGDKKAA